MDVLINLSHIVHYTGGLMTRAQGIITMVFDCPKMFRWDTMVEWIFLTY